MRTISIPRPQRKKLGSTAIVAMKRNQKTGRIVNQEWWDYYEFESLINTAAFESMKPVHFEGIPAHRIPRWIRWALPTPIRYTTWEYSPMKFKALLRTNIIERLEENQNQ